MQRAVGMSRRPRAAAPLRQPDQIRIPSPQGPLARPFFICEIAVRRRPRITAVRLRELLDYNDETGEFRWRKRISRAVRAGDPAGTLDKDGYRKIAIAGRQYRAHQLAWVYKTGKWCPQVIDHRDGDPSNNRWANLRSATISQNNANRRLHRNNKCGFKGVIQNHIGRWVAAIYKDGQRYHLGSFATPEEAHAAYAAAAPKLHGEFARTE
jgi:HNH endonuclease/AP2 domain